MEDADAIANTELLESDDGIVEVRKGREVLWYPVGIALALLAASGAFLFCFSGRWVG